jgi:hypothetical protein
MALHWVISAGPFAGQHMTTRGRPPLAVLRAIVRRNPMTWVTA